MSDVPGLAAALAAQAALGARVVAAAARRDGDRRLPPERMAASGRMIVLGALLAGLAIGFRSQNAMLTLPLLAGVLIDRIGRGVAGAMLGSARRLCDRRAGCGRCRWSSRAAASTPIWPRSASQAGEDFAGVEMLYLNPVAAPRRVCAAAHVHLSLGLGGAWAASCRAGGRRRGRRCCCAIAGPSPRCCWSRCRISRSTCCFRTRPSCATRCRWCRPSRSSRCAASSAIAAPGGAAGRRRAWRSGRSPSRRRCWRPTAASRVRRARVVAAMQRARKGAKPGALALHQTFHRPLEAESVADVEPQLPSPPRREWLELARYWREGTREPLWFLADPRRTDLALDRSARAAPIAPISRGDFSSLSQIGGMRPAAGDLVSHARAGVVCRRRLGADAGNGRHRAADGPWTVARTDHGVGAAAARAGPRARSAAGTWVRRRIRRSRSRWRSTDVTSRAWESGAGFFRARVRPAGRRSCRRRAAGAADDRSRARSTAAGSPTAIEQFDLQSARLADVGVTTRAGTKPNTTRRSACGAGPPTARRCASSMPARPVAITLRVERPRRYFDDDPIVRMHGRRPGARRDALSDSELWSVHRAARGAAAHRLGV